MFYNILFCKSAKLSYICLINSKTNTSFLRQPYSQPKEETKTIMIL